MGSFFDNFRQKVLKAVTKRQESGKGPAQPKGEVDSLISLGVLLWEVAQADEKYLPAEEGRIKEVLTAHGDVSEADMPIVLRAIEEASINRIDLYTFTKDVEENLAYQAKIEILEDLFRVACADQDLDHVEHEIIRKISGLLKLEHKDFIDAKLRVKKEYGLDTVGL